MADKNDFNKGLEDLVNEINQLYLAGKESTPEYRALVKKMSNYISQNAPKSSYSIENDPNYYG